MLVLRKYHILPGYKGYRYIRYILENYQENICMTKLLDVYTVLAKEFDTNINAVERDIRYILSISELPEKTIKKGLALLQEENNELLHFRYAPRT